MHVMLSEASAGSKLDACWHAERLFSVQAACCSAPP